MDAFTPTWLSQHAVPIAIASVQVGVAIGAAAQRRWRVVGALAAAVAAVALWLGPSAAALAQSQPLPHTTWGPVALAAPFLAIAAVALTRMRPPNPLKLRSTLGLILFGHGLAAWIMAIALLVSGGLQSTRSRSLGAGIVTWAASDVVHAQRYSLRSIVPLGDTHSFWAVGATEAALAAGAWIAVGRWMMAEPSPTPQVPPASDSSPRLDNHLTLD